MPRQNNPSKPFNQQLLIFVLILIGAAVYQFLNRQSSPTPPPGGSTVPSLEFTLAPFEETPTTEAASVAASMEAAAAETLGAGQTPTTQADVQRRKTPTPTRRPTSTPSGSKAKFDYYVLALSWSPDYCATSGNNDPQQCAVGKKLGFVLHGLWPQNTQGYPSFCSTQKMTQAVKDRFPNLYPSTSLYEHEWEKHGTCSGLDPAGYLAFTQQVKESVAIPQAFQSPQQSFRTTTNQLKQQFTQANPGFDTPDFEVNCSGSGRYLKELYVCFTRDGQPTACRADVHQEALKSCQSADFVVRNTR